MTPIVAIRPEPGCSATVAAGAAMGLPISAYPLSQILSLPWPAPDAAQIDALLIGSANALRHAGSALAEFSRRPVHAVGQTTAALAEAMGHPVASVGEGGLQHVIDRLPPIPIRLLRLTGTEHVPLELPPNVTVVTRVVYDSALLPISEGLAQVLGRGAVVLIHSAAAARHFGQECDRLMLPRRAIAIAALGLRIAQAAGLDWADCRSAPRPNDPALLALAKEMCH